MASRRQNTQLHLLDEIDEDDVVIGQVAHDVAHREGRRHRSVHVLLFNNRDLDNLLVSTRAAKKGRGGMHYHLSAAGHVESGESYENAAESETLEELFYRSKRLTPTLVLFHGPKFKNDTYRINKEIVQGFYGCYAGTHLRPIPEEIERVDWMLWKKVCEDVQPDNPRRSLYTPDMRNAVYAFLHYFEKNTPFSHPRKRS